MDKVDSDRLPEGFLLEDHQMLEVEMIGDRVRLGREWLEDQHWDHKSKSRSKSKLQFH